VESSESDSEYIHPKLSCQSIKSAFIQSVGVKIFILVFNTATGILSARALQPSGRGELAAIILWNVLFANAFTLGIPSALTYQLKKRHELRSEFVGAALLLSGLTSLLAMVIAAIGLPHWIPQYSATAIFYSRLFLFNVPLFAASLVGRAALESEGDFTTSNLSLLLNPLLTLTALCSFLLAHHLTPVNASWAYMFGSVFPALFVLHKLLARFKPIVRSFRHASKLLMSYGIRSYGIDLCGTMSFYVDQVLVVHLLQSDTMGTYVVALSLSRMLNAFHSAIIMVLFPNMISQSRDVVHFRTGRAVRMTTFVTATAGALIALIGPRLVTSLYGKSYSSATGIVRVLILEVILSGTAQVLSQAFMALGRPGTITIFQVSSLVLTIPLLIVLVPRYGIHGAALAILLSTTIRLIAIMASFRPLLKMRCPSIFLNHNDWCSMLSLPSSLGSRFGKASKTSSAKFLVAHNDADTNLNHITPEELVL
jgi:O-antigen/teichoic acid export membrane protein